MPTLLPPTPVAQTWGRRGWLLRAASVGGVVAVALLGGCGFALREAPKLAFASLQFAGNENSSISRSLQREFEGAGIRVLSSAAVASSGEVPDAILTVALDRRERVVVGQTDAGQVRELELRLRFRYTLSTPAGKLLQAPEELVVENDISFTETAALAKAAEESLVFTNMQEDVVQQVMRLVAAVKTL